MVPNKVALAALCLALAACGSDTPGEEASGVHVVATTDVLADVVEELVGDAGTVQSLMEPGADPHEFAPSADEAALLRSSDLVVANGLGLEAGLAEMLESANREGTVVVELAEFVDPLPLGSHADEADDHDHDHDHDEEYDPHFTLDPLRMADAVDVAADALGDLHGSADWSARAAELRAELEALHQEVERVLEAVPAERRKLVTNHDALGYFADRYDFEVVGTVIPGGSTLAEPSASDLADLAELLRAEGVRAMFADSTGSTRLAETVAAEVGSDVSVHRLYTGSLGPEGSGAETYTGMMRTNAATIAAALGD